MKHTSTVMMMVVFALFVGCNGYGCSMQPPIRNGDTSFNADGNSKEEAEKKLINYISKRVVRVVILCQIVNIETGVIIQKYKETGWGTGAIVVSTDKYSLIQTAAHVIDTSTTTKGNLQKTCDKFSIEQRDVNNKIINTYDKVGILTSDATRDIGVLRIPYNLSVSSRLANSIYLGQRVRVIGYPFLRGIKKSQLSYSNGHVATINIERENSINKSPNQMRIDLFGYMGSSGGAVWTSDGRLVGTVTMLTGWRTFGGYIPQHSCLYGPSVVALKNFYREKGITEVF